jgi:lipopolysaccharide assembly protein A
MASEKEHEHPTATRTGRVWWAVAGGLVVLLLVIVFIIQNSTEVKVHFLWTHGTVGLGLALLLAAIMGALVVVLLGSARIIQLRVQARRAHQGERKAGDERPPRKD